VKQSYFAVERWDKRRLLLHLLKKEKPELTVVFCRTKRAVDEVAQFLNKHKIDAHAMHGDMYQKKRDAVMGKLRGGDLSVLVASDLAARGLDVEDISHVVNYDMPESTSTGSAAPRAPVARASRGASSRRTRANFSRTSRCSRTSRFRW
jgi:superfamily II DNA/RNA helicase